MMGRQSSPQVLKPSGQSRFERPPRSTLEGDHVRRDKRGVEPGRSGDRRTGGPEVLDGERGAQGVQIIERKELRLAVGILACEVFDGALGLEVAQVGYVHAATR